MFPQKSEKIVTPDAAMAARSPVRRQQVVLDPIDDGPGIYLEKTADVVSRVDGFCFRLLHDAVAQIFKFVLGSILTSVTFIVAQKKEVPSLSQFVWTFAMKIYIREWNKEDLLRIQPRWLDYCRTAVRPDMQLKPNCKEAMANWLLNRFEETSTIAYVAEKDGALAGFLIGRIDEWKSVPPVIESRRIGIIDAVYVAEAFRRQGIASRLIERAIQAMQAANATAVETIYEVSSDASLNTWRRAGFAPWMVHAYRML